MTTVPTKEEIETIKQQVARLTISRADTKDFFSTLSNDDRAYENTIRDLLGSVTVLLAALDAQGREVERAHNETCTGFDVIFPYVIEAYDAEGNALSLADKISLLGSANDTLTSEVESLRTELDQWRIWHSNKETACGHHPCQSYDLREIDPNAEHGCVMCERDAARTELAALRSEKQRLQMLTRTYPFDQPSLCSWHSERDDSCSTCYPDLWALIGEHVKVSAASRAEVAALRGESRTEE